jgi:hypothetical protein
MHRKCQYGAALFLLPDHFHDPSASRSVVREFQPQAFLPIAAQRSPVGLCYPRASLRQLPLGQPSRDALYYPVLPKHPNTPLLIFTEAAYFFK